LFDGVAGVAAGGGGCAHALVAGAGAGGLTDAGEDIALDVFGVGVCSPSSFVTPAALLAKNSRVAFRNILESLVDWYSSWMAIARWSSALRYGMKAMSASCQVTNSG